MKKNLVAVVILSYNKKNDLIVCLNSIFKMSYEDFEVIVVDNGSTDGSAEIIKCRFPGVHLIESKKNLGVAGGRNLGIRYANENLDYKFLLFLDDDIIIDENALAEMESSFTSDCSIGIVAPKCCMANDPGVLGYAGGMSVNLFTGKIVNIGGGKKDSGQFNKSEFISSSAGLCLVKRELLNKTGMFDEKFNPYGWEDVDFSLRAKQNGFKIFYNHKAVIYHKGGKEGRGRAVNEYEFAKSKNFFYLIKKHCNIYQLFILSIALPFRLMILMIKELFKGEFKTLSAQFNGALSLINKKQNE